MDRPVSLSRDNLQDCVPRQWVQAMSVILQGRNQGAICRYRQCENLPPHPTTGQSGAHAPNPLTTSSPTGLSLRLSLHTSSPQEKGQSVSFKLRCSRTPSPRCNVASLLGQSAEIRSMPSTGGRHADSCSPKFPRTLCMLLAALLLGSPMGIL
jgi:hypothetical protein